MRILLSGSSGLIGTMFRSHLESTDHEVVRLVRSKSRLDGDTVLWDSDSDEVDTSGLENADVVVHLAGKNIASGRWTDKQKQEIRDSRVHGTQLLCEALNSLSNPPKTLVAASAVGYYGDRGDEVLTEESPPGDGFLSDVCQEWETATQAAAESGIRVVNLRFAMVLSGKGGALPKMLPPFLIGLGGIVGDGQQYWSWVAAEDACSAIFHCIQEETLHGPVNCAAPSPVTNHEFTKSLGRVLSRPTIVPLPAFAARLLLGEMADALLLASARVHPEKLTGSGFSFTYTDIESALRSCLRK